MCLSLILGFAEATYSNVGETSTALSSSVLRLCPWSYPTPDFCIYIYCSDGCFKLANVLTRWLMHVSYTPTRLFHLCKCICVRRAYTTMLCVSVCNIGGNGGVLREKTCIFPTGLVYHLQRCQSRNYIFCIVLFLVCCRCFANWKRAGHTCMFVILLTCSFIHRTYLICPSLSFIDWLQKLQVCWCKQHTLFYLSATFFLSAFRF